MQHAKSLAVCVVLVVAAYLVGRSTLEAQQPVPTLDRQFTPGTVFADARTPISSLPFTIDRCGSYFLTGCLTGGVGENGITVNSDDVTIDLNGFTLIGVEASLHGIEVVGAKSGVVVHDGTVSGWDGDGILAPDARDSSVLNVQAHGNTGSGIVLGSTTGAFRSRSRILSCVATENGADGIKTRAALVKECHGSFNGAQGIRVLSLGIVAGCHATDNQDDGINVTNNSTVTECLADANGGNGIWAGARCMVMDSLANGNTLAGIRVENGTGETRVEANSVSANQGSGVSVVGSDNLIIKNSARNNTPLNYSIAGGNQSIVTGGIAGAGVWDNISY